MARVLSKGGAPVACDVSAVSAAPNAARQGPHAASHTGLVVSHARATLESSVSGPGPNISTPLMPRRRLRRLDTPPVPHCAAQARSAACRREQQVPGRCSLPRSPRPGRRNSPQRRPGRRGPQRLGRPRRPQCPQCPQLASPSSSLQSASHAYPSPPCRQCRVHLYWIARIAIVQHKPRPRRVRQAPRASLVHRRPRRGPSRGPELNELKRTWAP